MEGMSSGGGLEIGISCITVPHLVTEGQKHTHTQSLNLFDGFLVEFGHWESSAMVG
jgi:hypothetical protein